ncbi:tail fiber domain-containing protein [Pseudescherichia vulneris]|uniref:tail fiber domain-containing protein n=1 Tax=Pseudescherichia vulneris TaxID=566 RepID=UPI001EDCBC7A|nr:tail fiber domain-containing protein [Pseudescherichia vulneris]
MINTTGTIAGSGNTLTGTGTNFAVAGSLIRNGCTVIVMTSPVQVFQITAVNSATQLAVTPAVNPAIPAGTRYAILLSDSLSVDGLAQDIAETFKMYQAYMSGFADVMTGTGNVTITINGTPVTVPAQKSLVQKGANGAAPIVSGGTGATTAAGGLANLRGLSLDGASNLASRYRFSKGAYGLTFDDVPPTGYGGIFNGWNNAPIAYNHNVATDGMFFADSVHRYVYSGVAAGAFYTGVTASTTEIAYAIGHVRDAGTLSAHFVFNTNGSAYASSGNWVNSSDERIKKDITRIENPLAKMRAIKGCTWFRKDNDNFGIGFIAQDIQTVFPDAVTTNGSSLTMADGEVVKNVLFPDTMGVAAGLHHEAILALMDENEAFREDNKKLHEELDALKMLVQQLVGPTAAENQ